MQSRLPAGLQPGAHQVPRPGACTTSCGAFGAVFGGYERFASGTWLEKTYDLSAFPHSEVRVEVTCNESERGRLPLAVLLVAESPSAAVIGTPPLAVPLAAAGGGW